MELSEIVNQIHMLLNYMRDEYGRSLTEEELSAAREIQSVPLEPNDPMMYYYHFMSRNDLVFEEDIEDNEPISKTDHTKELK